MTPRTPRRVIVKERRSDMKQCLCFPDVTTLEGLEVYRVRWFYGQELKKKQAERGRELVRSGKYEREG